MRRIAAVVLPAVVGLSVVCLPGTAWAGSCALNAGVLNVTVADAEAVMLVRSGSNIVVSAGASGACTGSPTVTNVSDIVSSGGGTLIIDLAGGAFAPGLGAETDVPEIEFYNSAGTTMVFRGGPGRDELLRVDCALDLNFDGDSDLSAFGDMVVLDGGDGDDFVMDIAGPSSCTAPTSVAGGDGNDRVVGSAMVASVDGGPGPDQVVAGRDMGYFGFGNLALTGGTGDDLLVDCRVSRLSPTTTVPQAIPDGGSIVATIPVTSFTSALEVRLSASHAHTEDLALTLSRGADTVILADPLPAGANVTRVVFDDEASTPISSAIAPFTGRYQPEEPLSALLDDNGPLTLTVTDKGGALGSGTLLDVKVDVTVSSSSERASLNGGPGLDTVDYGCRTSAVVVDLPSGSGGTLEEDLLTDVENVRTGPGSDTITGNELRNVIDTGTGGFDVVESAAGNDAVTTSANAVIDLGEGDDTFTASRAGLALHVLPHSGNDTLTALPGPGDRLIDFSSLGSGVTANMLLGTATGADGNDTFSGFTGLVGTGQGDQLTGDHERNLLVGGGGVDAIVANGGDDIVIAAPGVDGADDISGGPGLDSVTYGERTLPTIVRIDNVANDGASGEGDNVRTDVEKVYTGSGADFILTDANAVEVGTNAGTDTIQAPGLTAVHGGDGTDTLDLYAAPSRRVVNLATGSLGDGVSSRAVTGIESLIGTGFNDSFTGGAVAESFAPSLGDDTVVGGGGNDRYIAGGTAIDGKDSVSLGVGIDTIDASARSDAVSLSLDGVANDGAPGEGDNIGSDAENILGGRRGDVLIGNNAANQLLGNAGNDVIGGRGGADVIDGGDGDDSLSGHTGDDTISGGASGNDSLAGGDGNDTLAGLSGADVLAGGHGDDNADGGADNDRLVEGDSTLANGSDLLRGGTGVDTVTYLGRSAGVRLDVDNAFDDGATDEQDNVVSDVESIEGSNAADVLTGSSAANSIKGHAGNDVISGALGNDALDGGAGDDRFWEGTSTSGADTMIGGTGVDTADYSSRSAAVRVDLDNVADDGWGETDNVRSDVENILGGRGADVLTGSAAVNRLLGGAGNDTITGGGGADYLHGGLDNDTLYAKDSVVDTVVGDTGTDKAQRDASDSVSGVESFF